MGSAPWGGSEELWSRSAIRLAQQGFNISASVHAWSPAHARIVDLMRGGVDVHMRALVYPAWRRVAQKLVGRRSPATLEYERYLLKKKPNFVVISNGDALPPLELAELCTEMNLPFVTIAHGNYGWWPDDDLAKRFQRVLRAATRIYFVSQANRRILEGQIGADLPNAEIVRNPFNVCPSASPPWPCVSEKSTLRLACVARLHPQSKGQDILFEVLAGAPWDARDWTLSLYGDGPNKEVLMRYAERLGLRARVSFRGHVTDVARIWAHNHLLVLPSRCEGLPLSLVEAMFCGRPAVTTRVGGNAEIVNEGETGFLADAPTTSSVRDALERSWNCRGHLRQMGKSAATHIRELVPADPVNVFVDKLKTFVLTPRDCRAAAD